MDAGSIGRDAGVDSGTTSPLDAGRVPPTDGGPIGVIQFLELPALVTAAKPVDEGTEWVNGEGRVVRDNHGTGEFFTFRWSESAGPRAYLFASPDGRAWRQVTDAPTTTGCVGSCGMFPGKVFALLQDSGGVVHALLGANDYGLPELREYYTRLELDYDGAGKIARCHVKAVVPLPSHHRSVNVLSDLRGDLQLIDYQGAEALLYTVSVTTVSGSSTMDIKVSVGRAKTLAPTATTDFVDLQGHAGDTLAFDSCAWGGTACTAAPNFFSTHNMIGRVAQLGATHDLYLLVGPIEADYGIGDPSQLESTRLHLTRLRWDGASGGWLVGTPSVIAEADGQYLPQLLDVVGTDAEVRVLVLLPATGVHVGSIDSAGVFHDHSNPDPLRHYNGWGVLSASRDGSRMWAIWNTCTSDNATPALDCTDARTAQAVWDGARWQVFEDTVSSGDNSGLGGTAAWRGGVAAILFRGTLLRPKPPVPEFSAIWN